MSTLTIQIEDASLIEKAARIAREKKISVDAMVVGFLSTLSEPESPTATEEQRRKLLASELEQTIRAYSRDWGGRGYLNRDELYER